MDLYARVYEELMAVPVIKGRKSEKEKFAGGAYTTTVEAFIPATGRAVQGATSHCLGENFSKMFNIEYSTEDGKEKKYVTQNSWGLTTRTLGVLVMVHGDDVGLVLPPRMAPIQVVIVWIVKASDSDELKQLLPARADAIAAALREAGVRTKVEHRVDKTASWKYNHWEQKGVPVRIEIGGKEIEKGSVIVFRRDKRTKEEIPEADTVPHVAKLMKTIQSDMLLKARRERDSRLSIVTEWDSFIPELDKGNLVLAPWCEETASEEWVKETTKQAYRAREKRDASAEAGADADADADKALSGAAKTLCIPFAQPEMPPGQLYFTSAPGSPAEGKLATVWCLWGRSY